MAESKTILVVEDDLLVSDLIDEVLAEAGFIVLCAENPTDAEKLASNYAGAVDLLLTDVVMPETSGFVLAQRIVALRPETPNLFMSGYSDEMLAERGFRIGGQPFLRKPFGARGLVEAVERCLRRRGGADQP